MSERYDEDLYVAALERIAALEFKLKEVEAQEAINRRTCNENYDWAKRTEQERDVALKTLDTLNCQIETLIGAMCNRCARGDQLFIEPSTGFYTHNLGGNYCNSHKLHNLLDTRASKTARDHGIERPLTDTEFATEKRKA